MSNKISYLALVLAIGALLLGFMPPSGNGELKRQETTLERLARTKTFRCGYILYPPYLEKDPNTGKLHGIGFDMTEEIAKTLGQKVEWAEEVPVGGEIATLAKGSVDAICSITGAYDANIFDRLAFSDYLFIVKNRVYARANDDRFKGPVRLEALNREDISFAGIEGDTSFIFPQMLAPKAKMKSLPALSETAQLFQDVKFSKADLLMVEAAPGMKAMQANPDVFRIVDVQNPLPSYAAQIAFSKRDLDLRDTFNETIRFMKLNAQFDPILNTYDPTGQVLIRGN